MGGRRGQKQLERAERMPTRTLFEREIIPPIPGLTAPLAVTGPQGAAQIRNGVFDLTLTNRLQQALRDLEIIGAADLSESIGNARDARSIPDLDQLTQREFERLTALARPEEDRLRARVRGALGSTGRLGVGIGGGRTGAFFQPEIASLEEALATAGLERAGAARGLAERERAFQVGEEERIFNRALRSIQAQLGIRSQPLSLADLALRTRVPLMQQQTVPTATTQFHRPLESARMGARSSEAFFSRLGSEAAKGIDSLFRFQGGSPDFDSMTGPEFG